MTFAERKANSSESFSWDRDHHVDCYRNNDSFEWMPKVWKRYSKPMRLNRRNCCEVRKNGFLNKGINNQKTITDGETESRNKCRYIKTVISIFRISLFLSWEMHLFSKRIRTQQVKYWNPCFHGCDAIWILITSCQIVQKYQQPKLLLLQAKTLRCL